MNNNELYECHNWNKDNKVCRYRGSNKNAKKCPMCGGTLSETDWFEKEIKGDIK